MHRLRDVRRDLPERRDSAVRVQRRPGARGTRRAARAGVVRRTAGSGRRRRGPSRRTGDPFMAEGDPSGTDGGERCRHSHGGAPGDGYGARMGAAHHRVPLLLVLLHRRGQRRHGAAQVPAQRRHHPRDVLGPHRPRPDHDRLRARRGRRDGVRLPHRRLPLHRGQPQDDGAHAARRARAGGLRHRARAVRPRVGERRRGRQVRATGAPDHRAGAPARPARLARAHARSAAWADGLDLRAVGRR